MIACVSVTTIRSISAESLRNQNVDVAMMIQADMLGYHSPEEPPQLGYTPSYAVTVSIFISLFFKFNPLG